VHPCHASDNLSSTIGEEKANNQAFALEDKPAFLSFLTKGQHSAPAYFLSCVSLNKTGPPLLAASTSCKLLPLMQTAEFFHRLTNCPNLDSVYKLDTREAGDFANSHVSGFLNFPMSNKGGVNELTPDKNEMHEGNFAVWVGRMVAMDVRIFVITAPGREREGFSRLGRVGMCNNVEGILDGGFQEQMVTYTGLGVARNTRLQPSEVPKAQESGEVILDVRTRNEFVCQKNGHLAGAYSAPVFELQSLAPELRKRFPGKSFVVYCRGGFRSAVASSILQAAGFTATDVVGGYAALQQALPEQTKNFETEGFLVESTQ